MSCTSAVVAGAVNDIVPTAKVPGAVRAVQSDDDVGYPVPVAVSHTCTVKPVVLAETTSTPVRVYPDAFEPVVKLCANPGDVLIVSVGL